MKNFLKSVGKASVYFLVYFMTQIVVSMVYGVVWSAKITTELMEAGEAVDALALSEQLSVQIMDKAVEMTFWSGVVALLIYWIRFAVRKKSFLKEVGVKKIAANGIVPIVITALSLNVVISMVISNLPWPQEWIDSYMTNSSSIDGSLMSWLAAVVMAPVLEEIVFRGLVYTRLKKGMPAIVAAFAASFLFGLCHGTPIWIIYATVLGLVMTWVFERYQSLTANILFHFSFNAMGLILSMIPEEQAFVILVLFFLGVAGIIFGVKQIVKSTKKQEIQGEQAMHVLENEKIKVSVADYGAELSSVLDKETGVERLWDANPAVWNRHAPILFPFVGKVANGVYRIGEKEYEMKTQHGFARDMVFECIEANADTITHRLVATEETKEKYPYDFELLVTHKLDAENDRKLHVIWEVKNNGEELMYYSIGAHPAFTLPVVSDESRQDYYLEFPNATGYDYVSANDTTGLIEADKVYRLNLEDGFVKLFDGIYQTLIFDYQNIETVRIARPDKTPYVTMTCEQFPMLGIWMKPSGEFVCLEPWVGRADNDGFIGTLEEKVGEQKLEAGETKKISYTMEFHR